ncbi:hypothetical protein BDZ89DRAFT_1041701 [Hymenopellis radicata]|nr:hypothetical protein BDZ89DRAFT_1041701 [Hymenopellis radicata]
MSSSPYAMFLGKTVAFTGAPQDAVLRAELKSFIATVIDKELRKLDARSWDLAEELRSVRQTHAAIQAFRDAHVAIFPPVHSLPPEIISQIFSLLVGDERVVLPALSDTAPWNLLTVCQYWRNIALSLPCLWSSFNIRPSRGGPRFIPPPPMVHREDRALPLEVVKHLSLSKHEPLTFALEASEGIPSSQIPLAELIEQSHRWKDVTLIASSNLDAALPNFEVGRLEILHSLSVQQFPSMAYRHPYTEDVLQKFANARQLRRLTFETPVVSSLTFRAPSTIAFPWAQLTYLKIISDGLLASDDSPHPGCYRLLEACPRLQTLVESDAYRIADRAKFALPPGTPILKHHVRILELVQPAVLSHLQCPDLTHLSLPPITSQESANVVADFCRRSSCTELKKVDAKLSDTSTIDFTAILLALASVEALTFQTTSSWTMELCTHFIADIISMPQAAPRLRSLQLKICDMAVWASNSEGNTKLVRYLARGVQKCAFSRVHIDITGDMSRKESDIAKLASFESALRNSTLYPSQLTIVNSLVDIFGKFGL